MSDFKKFLTARWIGGSIAALLAIMNFIRMFTGHVGGFYSFLLFAAFGAAAVFMFLDKGKLFPAICCAVLTLAAFLQLFKRYHHGIWYLMILVYLLEFVAYAAMAALAYIYTTNVPIRKKLRPFWFIPGGVLLINAFFDLIVRAITCIVSHSRYNVGPAVYYIIEAIALVGLSMWLVQSKFYRYVPKPKPAAPAAPVAQPQAARQAQPVNNGAQTAAATQTRSGAVDGFCSMGKHVALLLFTFGVWSFIWTYRTTRVLSNVEGEPFRSPGSTLVKCMLIPFYYFYWLGFTAARLDILSQARGIPSNLKTPCILLTIFVWFFPIAPIMLQKRINQLSTME